MDERIKFFVGLDVHKDSISVAACDASREPARFVGTVDSDVNKPAEGAGQGRRPGRGQRGL